MIPLTINGKEYNLELKGNETLLEVLREHLGLTGTKTSCDDAECGACTVNINGKAVLSCITLAADLEGDDILTIEGLSSGNELHPIQKAFIEEGAVQCGFCTPGMIMSAKPFLEKNPAPTESQIDRCIDGNICRCGGYLKIKKAIKKRLKTIDHRL